MTARSTRESRRRSRAILGVLALALLQVSVALHQFEHADGHGLTVCQLCSTFSQLDSTTLDSIATTDLQAWPDTFVAFTVEQPRLVARAAPYQPRAPPIS